MPHVHRAHGRNLHTVPASYSCSAALRHCWQPSYLLLHFYLLRSRRPSGVAVAIVLSLYLKLHIWTTGSHDALNVFIRRPHLTMILRCLLPAARPRRVSSYGHIEGQEVSRERVRLRSDVPNLNFTTLHTHPPSHSDGHTE